MPQLAPRTTGAPTPGASSAPLGDQAVRGIRGFIEALAHDADAPDHLRTLCTRLAETLGAVGCAASLGTDDELCFVTASSARVAAVEAAQHRSHNGPRHDALAVADVLVVEDIGAHRRRWPSFCREAEQRGLASVLALPMLVDEVVIGCLDVYGDRPRRWTGGDVALATALAEVTAAHVVQTEKLRHARRRVEQLQTALRTRPVIEQAKGKLAARRGISIDDAFAAIRRHARNHNLTVRFVAGEIVDRDIDVVGPVARR